MFIQSKTIKSDCDAVFLPGKIHGCEEQVYIIYYNDGADNGQGCWEIMIVDKERILTTYAVAKGDAEIFFSILPDYFHGEWRCCYRDSADFDHYTEKYNDADFVFGRDGGIEDEMMFLLKWANS